MAARHPEVSLACLCGLFGRGSQYCCRAYVGLLQGNRIAISMTEDHRPTDNAVAERVNGIIKTEWLYRMRRFSSRRRPARSWPRSSASTTPEGHT